VAKMLACLGLMSGTSMDGIDLAMMKTDGENRIERGRCAAFPFTCSQRKVIERAVLAAHEADSASYRNEAMREAELVVTRVHVEAVQSFLNREGMDTGQVDLIGFHGQTVLHRPQEGFTIQLGDGQALADATGISTVFHMRTNDMKNAGQGAPLVPVYHQAIAHSENLQQPVCFVNIGGISNLSYVHGEDLIAFDCGPGNALIDQWMQSQAGIPMDQDGAIASEGRVISSVVKRYLSAGFFHDSAPKSLDRSDFPPLDTGTLELADGARTLARVTAEAIANGQQHLPEEPVIWIIAGGGRHNPNIMKDLRDLLKGDVLQASDIGLNGDMLEAEAWSYLAVRSKRGLPLTFPTTTGCKEPTTGGVLYNPKSA